MALTAAHLLSSCALIGGSGQHHHAADTHDELQKHKPQALMRQHKHQRSKGSGSDGSDLDLGFLKVSELSHAESLDWGRQCLALS